MSEIPVFGGPPTMAEFFRNSDPLPKGGERTPGPLRLSPGSVFATGLTTLVLLIHVDATAASCGVLSSGMSAATERRAPEAESESNELESPLAWDEYLNSLNEVLPGRFARQVKKLWSDLSRGTEHPMPHAGPTPQGSFILTWDRERHHFEIEVFSDNHVEWFYCDRATDNYEGAEGNRQQAVTAANNYLKRLSTV